MPGENSNTGLGDYTAVELSQMTPADFAAAQARGFSKPLVASPLADVQDAQAALAELKQQAAGIQVGSSVPGRPQQPQTGGNVWGAKRSGDRDFICPSGQKCRLRKIEIEQLVMAGVLDQVTRLEGLAQTLIDASEGTPPAQQKMPSKEDFQTLLNLLNVVVPMAVVEPKLWADDDPTAPADAIRISDVDLEDRIAILNEALSKVKLLDNFRHPR
jgi:hypothetical protein